MRIENLFLLLIEFLEEEYNDLFIKLNDMCDLEYILCKADDFEKVLSVYENKSDYYDGIMFSGLIHYQMIKPIEKKGSIPFGHLDFSQRDFYKYLFKIYLK